MTEEDNSNNSRVYDTDGSDITFYSATSSPDSTWDSFTTSKASQSGLTDQSTVTPFTSDSSFDWFETFFDPASAVCDLDFVFEGMDQTLVDAESTFTKTDIDGSNRTSAEEHFEYPLSTSVDPLEFNFLPGNLDSSITDSSLPGIFDPCISPVSWNWSGSSVDDTLDPNRFEDLSFHPNDSDNVINRQIDSDTSPFSQQYGIPTTMDTLETESVFPSKAKTSVYESALNCGDSSVLTCISETSQLTLEDNYFTPSVSSDVTSSDVTWVAKSKHELGGDNQSMKAKCFAQSESSFIWNPLSIPFDHSLPDIFLGETTDPATEPGSRHVPATVESGSISGKDDDDMKRSMHKESRDEPENPLLFDSHEFLSGETDIIQTSSVNDNPLENKVFCDEQYPIPRCLKPASFDLNNKSSLKLKNQVSKTNYADLEYTQIEPVKEMAYMPDHSPKNVPRCQDSIEIGSSDLTHKSNLDKTTDYYNVQSDYPFSLVGVENSSQVFLKTSSIISASDQTAGEISSTCASSNRRHASVRKTERFDNLNSVIFYDSVIDKGNYYDKVNDLYPPQLSTALKGNTDVQRTGEATCAEVRAFENFKQSHFVNKTDTIPNLSNTSDKYDNSPDYRFKSHTLLNSKQPQFVIADTKYFWMNTTTTTTTTTATTITTTTPFMNKTNSTIFSYTDVSNKLPSPSSSMDSTAGRCDRANYPFVDGRFQKKRPRRNSDPSHFTAKICNFRSASPQGSFVVSFADMAPGKMPGSSNEKNSHPVLPSGFNKNCGKKFLKSSISAPNLLILLPKEAWNFSNISKTSINSSATGDISDHLVSSQQKEMTNEIKSNSFQDKMINAGNMNHNLFEQTDSMVHSLSSALSKTSNILEAPLVSRTVQSVTFPDTKNCSKKLELTKPIRMKVMGCPKSGKEDWSELIRGDFSQLGLFSTEMFTASEIDGNCNKTKSTNQDVITQMKRSSSLPSTLNQLKPMDLSAGVLSNSRTKDHFLVSPSRLGASSKTFDERDNLRKQTESEKGLVSVNLDFDKKLLVTSSDTSLFSQKDRSMESSASTQCTSPLTKKLVSFDLNRVFSSGSPATSKISSDCKSLQDAQPEITVLEGHQRININREESADCLFKGKIQLHSKSDQKEPVKHLETLMTKDTLREVLTLAGSQDTLKANQSLVEGHSCKSRVEKKSKDSSKGFSSRETKHPNNFSVLGDVNYETWSHLPNISNLNKDGKIFQNSYFPQIKKPSNENVSGLTNTKITAGHPEPHFDSSPTKVPIKDDFTDEIDKFINDIEQQLAVKKQPVEERISRVSRIKIGLTPVKEGEVLEKPIPSKLIFNSVSNEERQNSTNAEVNSFDVNRESTNYVLSVKKKWKSFPNLNFNYCPENGFDQINVGRLYKDESPDSSDGVLVRQPGAHLEKGTQQSSNSWNSYEETITTQIKPRSIQNCRRLYKSEASIPTRGVYKSRSEFQYSESEIEPQTFQLENANLIDEFKEKKQTDTDPSLDSEQKHVKGGDYSKLLSEGPLVPPIPVRLTLDDDDDDYAITPKAMCSYMPFDTDSEEDVLEISSHIMEAEQRANENSWLSCCCCCLFRVDRNRMTHTE